MAVYLKDPASVLDWQIDYADWLAEGETISDSTWAITPTTLSPLTEDSETQASSTATITLSGGLAGQVYRATNHITTSAGREDERTVVIRCEQL